MAKTASVRSSASDPQNSDRLWTDEEMRENREIRARIWHFLDSSRMLIDQKIATRGRQEGTVTLCIAFELGESCLARERVATIIRSWIFDRYKGRVGLDAYETTFQGSMIRLRV